ncbi:MAG: SDR family NAD(P)-dependent oxidoreductase [Daejeonella sp.]
MFNNNNRGFLEFILFPPTRVNENKLWRKLKDKTILITGASFGIGESLAYKLAGTGVNLILVARTEEKLILVKNKIEQMGGHVKIFPTDLSKPDQVQLLLDSIQQLPNGIDILVNNAGKSIRRSIYNSLDRYHDFTRTMAINYFGPVQLILALIPVLKKNKGHIINISAINVLLAPVPYWAAYQSSKSAFDHWFRSVSPELNAGGINTTSIYLPLVKTRMIVPTTVYQKMPTMTPKHVAKIICRYILNKNRKFAPWWLVFGQLGSIIFRSPYEFLTAYFLKRK